MDMASCRVFSILFADRVIREDNGKFGIIGVFDQLNAASVPFPALPWAIVVGLEEVPKGKHVVTINLVHDETQSVILPVTLEAMQIGEGSVIIPIPVSGIWIPQFGRYTLTVNFDGLQVGSRALHVRNLTETGDPRSKEQP